MYNIVKKVAAQRHFKVYRKEDVPSYWHFKDNPRIPPIFLLADLYYGFEDLYKKFKAEEEKNKGQCKY